MRRVDYWILNDEPCDFGHRQVMAVAGDPTRRALVAKAHKRDAVWLTEEQIGGLLELGFHFFLGDATPSGYRRGLPLLSRRHLPAEPLRLTG